MYLEIDRGEYLVQLYYETAGQGVPLVAIHGFTLDHRVMKGCLEPLFYGITGFKRVYFDLPGMGRTAIPREIRSSDAMLGAVLAFIEKVLPAGEKFALAGESYGGYLARAVINKMPDRVLGALLICPVIHPEQAARDLPPHAVVERDDGPSEVMDFFDREQFLSNIVVQTGPVWRRFKKEAIAGMLAADAAALDRIWKNAYGLSFDADRFEKPFDGPSLVICAKNDSIVGYRDAIKLFANFTRLSYVALDGCGHYLQMERPAVFGALASDWLKAVLAAAAGK